MSAFFRSIWTILRKDLAVWIRQPVNLAVLLVPALAFLLINTLSADAVGRSPVALVTLDHGPKGMLMRQIFHDADVFRITDATPAQAQQLLTHIDVVAVITIPADFTARVNAHETSPVIVEVNNLNLDFTNDIRRAVPDVITQFYQTQGADNPIHIDVREHDLRARDVELFQYTVLPTIVLLLTISGLVTSGLATAHEWEARTIKEMLLSPATRTAIISGKVLAGSIISCALGLIILGLGYMLGWTQPEGIYWLNSLLIIVFVALFSAGLGVVLGAWLQRIQPVTLVSMLIAFYLFFLAGGIGIISFEPLWLQNIAAFIPLTYGVHGLQMAIFYNSSDLLERDIAVLALSALLSVGLGIIALGRGMRQP